MFKECAVKEIKIYVNVREFERSEICIHEVLNFLAPNIEQLLAVMF